ncbi:MAG TPA: formylmethanofuran--tetrahydromethanopterin N-formyltransferase [Thermoflexia bacterium]|nr:MAG: formylmethanofuran--tetrahydromethanopterin N-formyltransferase [Chloroflexota bacterium]HEY67673.1 formylmethanofuran--tetrahydromethanopterin N-formyltransferase [Thermoflexia bacterium]
MRINGVEIEDTFAEAFKMWGTRLIITAINRQWAQTAAQATTGFATSVIGCGCEAGIERELPPEETPDGRPGISVLFFVTSRKQMEKQLLLRVGQGVMTCPTTACYSGLSAEEHVDVGGKLRYFGDGFQSSKRLEGRRLWRIPVMEGEFLIDERFGIQKAVGGGNFLILGKSVETALAAAEAAVAAMREVEGVVMPFPGGIVRSGSKVGSRYKFLTASTNTAYCPTLRGQVESALPEGVNAVLEIVVNGLTEDAVREAMRVGIEAACRSGIMRISAGNYGGTLGQYQIPLRELWQ